jgi:signal transduction histidine kinase
MNLGEVMFGKEAAGLGQKTWSKMQVLYFLIAFANLAATLCGLYLGHLLISIHQKSVAQTEIFDQQLKASFVIIDAASDTQAVYARSLDSNVYDQAQAMLESKAIGYHEGSALIRAQIPTLYDAESGQKGVALLDAMDSTMAGLEKFSKDISLLSSQGKNEDAHATANNLVEGYSALKLKIDELTELIESVKMKSAAAVSARVNVLRTYEFYIGAFLALVILCGAIYGYSMGRILKRKFAEMERTNRHLDEAHQQAMAFSKEIQTINSDMGTLNRQLSDNLTKLREAQDDALRKGKMAQLGNLTATVAHELRNPLSTVRTSAYLLARKIKDKGLDVDPQLLRINNGIIRCDNIITQLLDFSRSKAVKAEPTVLDVWLEKLVQAEAQKLPEIVSIECYFGLGDMLVDVEPGRLERAIINLLYNASEALVGKGDDPKARYRNDPVIRIVSRMTERGAEVAVSDNGPGISAENLAKIREPLFTTKNFGTGLGIPAVEQILEQHNGGLEITSVEGQGASFTLWLPVHTKVGEQAA